MSVMLSGYSPLCTLVLVGAAAGMVWILTLAILRTVAISSQPQR
jgi:hypothetical protein